MQRQAGTGRTALTFVTLVMTAMVLLATSVALTGCGGSGGGADPAGASATVDATGGQLSTAEGVSVTVPAGALASAATIRIAKDASGAPALPTNGLRAVGDVIALTPHGSTFTDDVTLRVPVPAVTLADNEQLRLAKAQPGGEWEILETTQENGQLVAQVRSFSFVVVIVVSYPLPMYQLAPLQLVIANVTCNGTPCANMDSFGPVNLQFTITNDGGQLPVQCGSTALSYTGSIIPMWMTSFLLRTVPTPSALPTEVQAVLPAPTTGARIRVWASCGGVIFTAIAKDLNWGSSAASANNQIGITNWPKTAIGISGVPLSLTALVATNNPTLSAQQADARIEWQSSNDGGKTWRIEAYSFAADWPSLPDTAPWRVSTVSHAITPSLSDNGSQWRLRVCWEGLNTTSIPESCALTDWLTLTVQASGTAPAFTQQPRDTMILRGQTASFTAVADASPAISGWQWQRRPANSTGAWADIAGATASTYTTPTLDLTDTGTQYRVLATNAAGSTPSDTVTAAVSDAAVAPGFTAQPMSLSVIAGSEAVFAVAARGTEALSYQWRKNGTPISGANASTLKLPAVAAGDAGAYSVVVTNVAGSVTSQDATLAVGAAVAPVLAPSIVTAPASVQVHAGDTASFAVGVGNAGPGLLGFQWFKDGNPIAGAGQAVLTLNAVTPADAGRYSVSVTNAGGGETSTAATLTVLTDGGGAVVAPTIDTQPATLTVSPGLDATLAVGASGSGPLAYQWTRDGTDIPGATAAVLRVSPVRAGDAASYRVRVSNAAGSVLSSAAQIVIIGRPTIVTVPQPVTVTEGQRYGFTVTASGNDLHYLWLKNGMGTVFTQAGTDDIAYLADSGSQWTVVVYNDAGTATSFPVTLTVLPAPTVLSCTGPSQTGWCRSYDSAKAAAATGLPGARFMTNAIAFGSATAGVAVSYSSDPGLEMLRTADGGITWTPVTAGPFVGAAGVTLYDVAFADANTVVAIGQAGSASAIQPKIYRSTDAGVHWSEMAGLGGTAVRFIDSQRGVINVGDRFLRTSDGGATWTPSTPDLSFTYNGVTYNQPHVQTLAVIPGTETLVASVLDWAGESPLRLIRSTDGGATWVTTQVLPIELLTVSGLVPKVMSFADANVAVMLGDTASPAGIWRTVDGGNSWVKVSTWGAGNVVLNADGTGVAVSTAVGVANVAYTADAGATWQTALSNSAGTLVGLLGVASPSSGRFVAGGQNSIVVNSQNGVGP